MKYKAGMWTPLMQGSAGATTASKNKYGTYFKNLGIPTNPQTIRQTLMRVFFASRSQFWRQLTQPERDAWLAAAINFPYTDQFGDQYTLQGNDLYIALNTVLLNTGQSILTSPPLAVAVTNFTSFTAQATIASVNLSFTPSPTPGPPVATRQSTIVYATPPLSPGITNFDKYLRQITVLPGGTASPAAVFAAYQAKFGAPILLSRIGFKLVPSRDISGQQGIGIKTTTIVI